MQHPPTSEGFRRQAFDLHPKAFTYANWGVMPPAQFQPKRGKSLLGERLPIDWDIRYRTEYRQMFQPAGFYQNAAALTNMATKSPETASACKALFAELFDCLMAHSVLVGDRRFVLNNFDFPRHGTIIPSGWSGSIMNAFALAGMIKAARRFRHPRYATAITEFANAFSLLNHHGHPAPPRWISYVDEDGYLWFDEYPMPDGSASRVLNGHIFSVLALALYLNWSDTGDARALIEGGLTAVKENILRFRRPGQVNLYDLRSADYPDYAPNRTVFQQAQLFALTGDEFFRGMAYVFYQDIKDSGFKGQRDWPLQQIATALARQDAMADPVGRGPSEKSEIRKKIL